MDCNLTAKQGLQLLGAIKANKSLKEIDFSYNEYLSEKFYIELASILKTNTTLKKVKITQCKNNYDLKKLADIYADSLFTNKTLEELKIMNSSTKNELNNSINLYLNDGTAGIVKFFLEKAFEKSSL